MGRRWFGRAWGIGWYPATWQGWLITLLYIVFIVWDFVRIDSSSHSVSDTLIGYIPQLLIATMLFSFICYFTGEKPQT